MADQGGSYEVTVTQMLSFFKAVVGRRTRNLAKGAYNRHAIALCATGVTTFDGNGACFYPPESGRKNHQRIHSRLVPHDVLYKQLVHKRLLDGEKS